MTVADGVDVADPELTRRLGAFLRLWLGAWPPSRRFEVATSPARSLPSWDGIVHPVMGVATRSGAVVSVPEKVLAEARALADKGEETFASRIGELVGMGESRFARAVFRYSERRVELPDAGEWIPRDDARVPAWLKPFNGGVLVALAEDGSYAAGVGLKKHNDLGFEIAVGTEPEQRNKGLAKRLVAQATRRIIDDGAVAIYLHAPSNLASAAVAEATGFPDRGWQVVGVFRHEHHAETGGDGL